VVVEPEELATLDVEATRTIDIEEFVDLSDIDPVYYERSYYLVPDGRAEKAYALLVETMSRTGKVAIGRFVLRTKQYLATLRARDGVLVLATMLYDDEVIAIDDVEVPTSKSTTPTEREIKMATQLVESLSSSFFRYCLENAVARERCGWLKTSRRCCKALNKRMQRKLTRLENVLSRRGSKRKKNSKCNSLRKEKRCNLRQERRQCR
jgi:Ku protein